jgi:hypothetical protein
VARRGSIKFSAHQRKCRRIPRIRKRIIRMVGDCPELFECDMELNSAKKFGNTKDYDKIREQARLIRDIIESHRRVQVAKEEYVKAAENSADARKNLNDFHEN